MPRVEEVLRIRRVSIVEQSMPESPTPSALLTFWRILTKFDATDISASLAIRNALCITIPLAIGAATGNPGAGLIAASGALNASFSDGHDPYRSRIQKMTAASVMCGLAVFLGSLTGNNHLLAICVSSFWAFGVGMLGALGTAASDVGNISLFTLCVYASQAMTAEGAALSGLLALSGGLLQTASALVLWPTLPYVPERRALSGLYRALSNIAESISQVKGAPAATAQIVRAGTMLTHLSRDRTDQAERFLALLDHAERIRLSLLVLVRLRRRLEREHPNGAGIAALDNFLAQFAQDLRIISRGVRTGNYPVRPDLGVTAGLAGGFQNQNWPEASDFIAALVRDTRRQVQTLVNQLDGVLELIQSATSITRRDVAEAELPKPWYLQLRGSWATLLANLNSESAVFRHALRLSVCIAVGDAVARGLHMGRSYWAPMTIAIVLRPDFSATFTRGILRIAGTMAGLTLATLLFHAFPSGGISHIVFIAALSFLMRWLGPGNYGIVAVAVSAIVVMMIAGTGVAPNQVIAARATNTVLGGVLALVSYALWPTWERKRIRPMIADLLDSYRVYFNGVMDMYRGVEGTDLDPVRSAGRVARTNATASLDRAAVEPTTTREDIGHLNAVMSRSNDFVKCVMALEAALPQNRPSCDTPEFRTFTSSVDACLECLSDALRSGDARSACGEGLQGLELRLSSEPYSLLNMEAERMVRALGLLSEAIH